MRASGRGATVVFVAALVVHLVVLYWPSPPAVGEGVPGLDKVVHVLVFASVAWTGRRVGLSSVWLGAALVGHAVVSEVLQHAVLADRAGDVGDVVADLVGVLLGLLLPVRRPPRPRRGDAARVRGGSAGRLPEV